MNKSRYIALDLNPDLDLDEEEIKDGWHFCTEWDFMLIHNSLEEFYCCNCNVIKNSNPVKGLLS